MQQPKALVPLFLTEMWERFGFYIVQGLMVLFLTGYFHYSDEHAYLILGEYSALIYIAPILGGYIADRVLGYRHAVLYGAIFLFLGYALIAITREHFLYLGMACAILGNGFLKPNISSYLGEFYTKNDPRREAGFTIFYIGINLGALMATLSSGFIQERFGWGASFGVAAIGLLFTIAIFYWGYSKFENKGLAVPKAKIQPHFLKILKNKFVLGLLFLATILLAYVLLRFAQTGEIIQSILGVFLFIILIYNAVYFDPANKRKFTLLIVLLLISVFFWGIFFQLFFSANLFVQRSVDRTFGGHTIPTIFFMSFEQFFILLLGPFLAKLWESLSQRKINLFVSTKFALALLATGIGMFVLGVSIYFPNVHGLVSPYWIVLSYFFITLGELLLSPIGLAAITELAPAKWVGLMMGIWFMTLGFGGSLAGYLAQMADIPATMTQTSLINAIFSHAFLKYATLAFAIGLIVLAINPWLKKLARN